MKNRTAHNEKTENLLGADQPNEENMSKSDSFSLEYEGAEKSGLQATLSCENYNKEFPRYPSLIEDKGWIHGVWYCGAFYKQKLYGDYPPTFLKRALSLFPDLDRTRLLHCPSGSINGQYGGMTVDLVRDEKRCPQVVASADNLPFPDNSFDVVLSDPPYSKADSEKYGTPHYPLKKSFTEFRRVLAPGGFLGLLHFYYPPFRRADWNMKAMIGVATGSNRKMRMFVVFQNTKEGLSTDVTSTSGVRVSIPKSDSVTANKEGEM